MTPEVVLDIVLREKVTTKMNKNTKYTAIKRDKPSYPLRILLQQGKIKGETLDFGCGFGTDVEELKEKGFETEGYDPHFVPDFPTKKFDTIICFYVLNVLLPAEQNKVMMQISSLLKENGRAYFAVRRDLRYEGYRMHVKHKKETYQCLVHLNQKSIFKNKNSEIYEFNHYTMAHKGSFNLNPFLSGYDYRAPFAESFNFVAFYNKYPNSEMVCDLILTTKERKASIHDLTPNLKEEYQSFRAFCLNELEKSYSSKTLNESVFDAKKGATNINQWYNNLTIPN